MSSSSSSSKGFLAATLLNNNNNHHHNHHDFSLTQNLTPELWQDYRVFMQDMMTLDRVVKNVKPNALPIVQEYLMSNSIDVIPNISSLTNDDGSNNNNNNNGCDKFRQESRQKYETFCQAKGWNRAQRGYFERCLSYTADRCAKMGLTTPAVIAWLKLREMSFVPRENTVSTFLFVLSNWEQQQHQSGNDDPNSALVQAALSDVAMFHDACYQPSEKTVTLRIKSLLSAGRAKAAEDLLQAIPNCQRLRTFTPLLSHYCDPRVQQQESASHALRLFRQMRESAGVYMDAETYVLILASLAEQGYFGSHAPAPDERMIEAGFSQTGPALFDALATEMAEDLLEFNETTAALLYRSFQSVLTSSPPSYSDLAALPPATTRSSSTVTSIMGRVTIDPSTCQCPATNVKLQLFSLTTEQRQMVKKTLLEMASSQHEEFASKMRERGKKRQDPASSSGAYALEQLATFADWVAQQNFTAIIDGPNVAYCGHPVLHYSQVARMVQYLESLGERPLVIMPYKYCQPSFFVATIAQEQTLSQRDKQVITELQEKGQLYVVPEWCLDDYYWMIASVVANATENTSGNATLPGLRPLLITNDQMRDHRLTLLEPRLFRRWTSCHIVRYDFGAYGWNEWSPNRPVFLEHADSISREIQGNPITDSGGATAWHIPITEWSEAYPHDRFCVSLRIRVSEYEPLLQILLRGMQL